MTQNHCNLSSNIFFKIRKSFENFGVPCKSIKTRNADQSDHPMMSLFGQIPLLLPTAPCLAPLLYHLIAILLAEKGGTVAGVGC